VVSRHLTHSSQKPFAEHTLQAFQQATAWLAKGAGSLIIDSCCGVGESTAKLALAHPNARVIGIDKSALRTQKHPSYSSVAANYIVLRADLKDFLRLLVLDGVVLEKHFLLYPNPYPKSAHLQRRWYASSTLSDIIQLGGTLEVRSNWPLYIQEFAKALQIAGIASTVNPFSHPTPISPFERKYWHSGQSSWQLVANLPNSLGTAL
jgi:tRNA G46 methylase TrmB